MATAELSKHRSKSKRRSMSINVDRLTNFMEDSDNAEPSTLPSLGESNPHILDLLLNESFSELELGLEPTSNLTEGGNVEINHSIESNDLSIKSNDNLESSVDGKEEINNALVSQDVIESLIAVKHVALFALDSLLHQIVSDQTSALTLQHSTTNNLRNDTSRRRYSFSHAPLSTSSGSTNRTRSQLLADIAHNATKLGINSEMEQIEPRRLSSPDIITINNIRHQLDSNSPFIPNDDYSLACTLAALLGYLYRILELCEPKNSEPNSETDPETKSGTSTNSYNANVILSNVSNDKDIYNTLHKEVTNLQDRSATLSLQKNVADERLATWNEIDRLMEIVASLCRDRSNMDPPPSYSNEFYSFKENEEVTSIDPPKYSSLNIRVVNEKTQRDLENVISAIDRVYDVVPQLNNQRVELNSRQKRELTAAALSTAIQKLSRGRLEEQRAESSTIIKYQTLNHLVDQISKAAERSFVDQRVELSPRQARHIEVAKLNGVIERLEKNRLTNQDWYPPEQLLIQDLTRLTNELAKNSINPAYELQRYQLTLDKEKNMFMNTVLKRIEKLQSYRLNDQDADPPEERKERVLKEIEAIIDKQLHSPSMNNQRATLSSKTVQNVTRVEKAEKLLEANTTFSRPSDDLLDRIVVATSITRRCDAFSLSSDRSFRLLWFSSSLGIISRFDQTINVILSNCHERIYSETEGVERMNLGLYIIRGDNIVLIGELDQARDESIDLSEIRAAPINDISRR
ncbi:1570_t:CDS:2 [Diversispora eburnea]|uniref:1570_t:CDS:1 n=1 Tax=Diversispora eburnea TaxID=1213867 RepID=A0A9N8YI55_9GLOM|nr:1570_t:CDS:2 [Diversispora eburnea]